MATNNPVVSVVELLKTLPKPKLQQVDPKSLVMDPSIQIRFNPGDEAFGFKTNFGDHAVRKLMTAIISAGRILVPLVGWERPKVIGEGTEIVVLRGNQRTRAVLALLDDPETPKGVIDAISKIPMEVYKNLTRDQALALVDDQSDLEPYKRVDFVNLVWKYQATGMEYKEIGLATARMYAHYVGNSTAALGKLKEINECKTRSAQLDIVANWMRGALDQGIMLAKLLGQRVRKAFLLTVAGEDGLITEGMEKAEFNAKGRSQDSSTGKTNPRLQILKKLKEKDPEGWDKDGSEFHKMIDEFVKEDAGQKERDVISRPTAAGCKKLQEGSKSTAFKVAYGNAAGDKNPNSETIDNEMYRLESIFIELDKTILPRLKNTEVASAVAFILKSGNATELLAQFEKWM